MLTFCANTKKDYIEINIIVENLVLEPPRVTVVGGKFDMYRIRLF